MTKTFKLWDVLTKTIIEVEAKKSGKEWVALCPQPEHSDTKPSLNINQEKGLFYCHACEWKGRLYDSGSGKGDLGKIVATYDYRDEAGKVVFQTVKFSPKDFRQRQPDKKGGWIENIKGVERVLYDLPELIKSSGPVFILEGEKDVDSLQEFGLTATCNPLGAKKWRTQYNRYLKGRDVFLIPDNDAPGLEHVERVARLLHGTAGSLKMLPLPGKEGGDFTDWKDNGGTREKLLELAKEMPEYEPKIEEEETGPLTVAQHLIKIARATCSEFFTDDNKQPFVRIPIKSHFEIHALESRSFTRWIAGKYYEVSAKPPHSHAVSDARLILSVDCQNGKSYKLHNRVARQDKTFWYDLTDDAWQAVRITKDGWEIVKNPPILFRRYEHQQPQVIPAQGKGDVAKILDFINLPEDKHLTLLIQVYLVSSFIPDIPHPILVLTGAQGAAKTSAFRFLREVLDPSTLQTLSFPRHQAELVQQLQHNWISYFDNVTGLPVWLSDILCRAVTGEGISKRKLYTDDGDFVYSYKRVVGLNAIVNPAGRPDFLDRCIIIDLERIPEERRIREDDLREKFEKAKPDILAGCFDALVHALRIYPLELPALPRMADFAAWGVCIAQGLRYKPEAFMNAYRENIAELNQLALEAQPLSQAVIALLAVKPKWEGTATQLLEEGKEVAKDNGIDVESKTWPGDATWTTRRLKEAQVNLQNAGIKVDLGKSGKRWIVLKKEEGGGV